ncbi:MAG: HDOD domain-containing protein, partial [Gammaproteobacteria bacterium]|nr:HDOD domain-containing protein [Gammaproteobacteria bacterium]
MGDIITKLLEETELTKLPSLPHVLIKLLKACHKDRACFDTLAEIINKDAALSAKVLSVANSPVYGYAYKLTSLKHILLYLGLETIKSIAITASVQQFFSRYSKEKNRFLKKFWEHTLSTALIAKSLAKLTSYPNPEEAYLAGLLHDIGKLIFENYSQHEYSVLVHANISTKELLEREKELYNISHDEIGAKILEIWGLPEVISEAIKYHHAETDDILEAHHLVKLINLASNITANHKDNTEILVNYGQRLFDLSDTILLDILNTAKTDLRKIATSMDIDIGHTELSENNDEEKQIQLAKEIRNIALTQGSMQQLNEDISGIDYSAVQKSTIILFGIDKSCVFLYNDEKNSLTLDHTTSQVNKDILNNIEIKGDSKSLIASVMRGGEMSPYFADDNESGYPVIDKQIISAFKTEGILCLPLFHDNQCTAVIVMGVTHKQYNYLMDKSSLLEMFTAEIADRIFSSRSGQNIRNEYIKNNQQIIKSKTREIIHEVNNPLAIIRNYLKILGNRLNESDPAQNDLVIISEEIDRVGSIILKCDEDFNTTSNEKTLDKININDLIVSLDNIMQSSLYATHHVKSHLVTDKNIEPVDVDKNALKQIMTNIIEKAVESMT